MMKIHNTFSAANTLNVMFFGFSIIILVSVFYYINPLKSQLPLFLNLAGSWQICIPNTLDKPIIDDCKAVNKIDVPHYTSPNYEYKNYHWLIYRKKFEAPKQCLEKNSLCSFIISEVGDAAEVWLNGNLIGETSDISRKPIYAKNFPLKVDLPTIAFKSRGQIFFNCCCSATYGY